MEKSKNGCINKQRGVRNNSYQFEERKKCHARKRHRAYRHLETTELANDPCKGLRYDLPRENIANSSKIRSAAAGRLKLWHCQTSALHVEAPELATPPPNWNATGTPKCVFHRGPKAPSLFDDNVGEKRKEPSRTGWKERSRVMLIPFRLRWQTGAEY